MAQIANKKLDFIVGESGQRREAVLACNVLNRMTELGRPVSYRIGR